MSVRATILDNLKIALETMSVDDGYELTPLYVTPYRLKFVDASKDVHPWIMIYDGDPEEKAAEDADDVVFYMPLELWGLVCVDTDDELVAELNKMTADLKKFVYSSPNLGDNMREIQFLDTAGHWRYLQAGLPTQTQATASVSRGYTIVRLRIIYACERGVF